MENRKVQTPTLHKRKRRGFRGGFGEENGKKGRRRKKRKGKRKIPTRNMRISFASGDKGAWSRYTPL